MLPVAYKDQIYELEPFPTLTHKVRELFFQDLLAYSCL